MTKMEKLDYVLNTLATTDHPYSFGLTYDELFKICAENLKDHKDDGKYGIFLRIALDKLLDDKYIRVDEEQIPVPGDYTLMKYSKDCRYSVTLNGYIFQEKGGYKGEHKRQTTSTNLQSVQTWAIAFGTILAAIASICLLLSGK